MKKIFILPALLLLAFSFTNCEKDDICDANTTTTPRLVIEFYDINNSTVLKNVTNLTITGDGLIDPLATYNNVSKIFLPLKTDLETTTYHFVFYSTSETLKNEDVLQFNYTTDEVFVSRACGYKTVFDLNDTNPVVLTDGADADGLSLQPQNIIIDQTNINTENEVHIRILF